MTGLIIDLFAGGGGASTGVEAELAEQVVRANMPEAEARAA